MSAVISPRTAPLAPANGYGVGGGCRTTRNSNGDAVFESSNYEITVTSNSIVTIHNKNTGETYQVSGDPHVSIDGVQAFDFHETMTFMLNDGTKVTIDTMPWGTDGATVTSRVTITNADANYGVQINGASLIDGRDISFEETMSLGQAMDDNTADNMVVFENARGSGFVRYDPASDSVVAVNQAGVNAMETAAAGGMFDPNAPAANNPSSPKGSSSNNRKATKMTASVSTSSLSYITSDASFLATLNARDPSTLDIATLLPANSYNSDGEYVMKLPGGGQVAISQLGGPGSEIKYVFTAANGVQFHLDFERDASGQYAMKHTFVSGTGTPATDSWVNQNLSGAGHGGLLSATQLVDEILDPSKKKKKGEGADGPDAGMGTGGIAGESGDSSNWFIALAESMGSILNKLAKELKSAVDNVVLDDNGQPPYKDSMRIQGLAQQLNFIGQALLTALNSIGEVTKAVVTAGGAAR